MFYCDVCAEYKDWPESWVRSFGTCEICGKTTECNDKSSSTLTAGDNKYDYWAKSKRSKKPTIVNKDGEVVYEFDERYDDDSYYEDMRIEREELYAEIDRWQDLNDKSQGIAEKAIEELKEAQKIAKGLADVVEWQKAQLRLADKLAEAAMSPVITVEAEFFGETCEVDDKLIVARDKYLDSRREERQ